MSDPHPMSDAAIVEMARTLLDLEMPPECLPGVRANLALLAEHAHLVGDLDD
ncbi:MAG: AtzG-like protein [Sphingomonas bacterium]